MTVWSKKALPPLVEGRLDSPARLSTLGSLLWGLRLCSLQGSECGFGTQLCWSLLFLRCWERWVVVRGKCQGLGREAWIDVGKHEEEEKAPQAGKSHLSEGLEAGLDHSAVRQ